MLHPEIFQGDLSKKHYFEGWYFKLVNDTGDSIFAFIPGIALDKKFNTSHTFLQVLNGNNAEYWYFEYPVDAFSFSKTEFEVAVDKNNFSWDSIHFDLEKDGHTIRGDLMLSNHQKLPWSHCSPNIMGWMTYLTFLECKHGVLSMNYMISGSLVIDGVEHKFERGKGYLEKDFGVSFPKSWIWMQSNHFKAPNLSIFFSMANVPLKAMEFTGFICNVWWRDSHYRFASYNGAKIRILQIEKERVQITLERKQYRLEIDASKPKMDENKHTAMMRAPISGQMQGKCAESLNSSITLRLFSIKNKKMPELLIEDTGMHAGLEIMATLESLNMEKQFKGK